MLKQSLLITLLACAMLATAMPAAALNLNGGEWEITTQVEMPGMPTQVPPMTLTQCITSDDPIPPQPDTDMPCETRDMKVDGDTVSWTMECDEEGETMVSTGKITYHGDSFEGTVENQLQSGGETMNFITRLKGKRIGDCN